jgi:Domain of unknown function (DUF222)/HNH endonuclease
MAEQNSFAEIPDIELADAMCQLAGGLSAIHSQLLAMAAEFDRRKAWRDDGAADMSAWLCNRLGLAYSTGKEWARVATALEELPECARVYSEGRLSWDQLRPLTLIANPETDAEHAVHAPGAPAATLEAAARRARRVELSEAEDQQIGRHLRWWFQGKEGFRLSGRLPAADGSVLVAALERVAGQQPEQEISSLGEAYGCRMGDALMGLASGQPAGDPHADRACVVVHVDAATLAGDGEGRAELEGGHPVHPEIARRLCCDGRLEVVVEGADGSPVGVGRARRTIPGWLWRLLVHRDGGRCRFCGCTRWLEGHHIVWWSRGGSTDLANLILTCTRCHKLFHEGGWTIEGDANGELVFRRPDGRALPNGPLTLRPQTYFTSRFPAT